jgi:hypothetical protein
MGSRIEISMEDGTMIRMNDAGDVFVADRSVVNDDEKRLSWRYCCRDETGDMNNSGTTTGISTSINVEKITAIKVSAAVHAKTRAITANAIACTITVGGFLRSEIRDQVMCS